MKHAIINSSQLAQYGRWDAAFHIAVKETADAVEKLADFGITPAIAYERLSALRSGDLQSIRPLCWGRTLDTRAATREDLLAAAERYPLIAYVLVLRERDKLVDQAKAALESEQEHVKRIERL